MPADVASRKTSMCVGRIGFSSIAVGAAVSATPSERRWPIIDPPSSTPSRLNPSVSSLISP
jgi:hypothetical protein